jgi:hypothetical protein
MSHLNPEGWHIGHGTEYILINGIYYTEDYCIIFFKFRFFSIILLASIRSICSCSLHPGVQAPIYADQIWPEKQILTCCYAPIDQARSFEGIFECLLLFQG